MKKREYKNFTYHSESDKNPKDIYYVCKCRGKYGGKCGGRISYNENFLITKKGKHTCIDTGKLINFMAKGIQHPLFIKMLVILTFTGP